MANDITSANAIFQLSVPGVFSGPQQLQGFATDDAFATSEVDIAETMLGVDGVMSAGYVPFIVPMTIDFQATSPSIANVMEQWAQTNVAAQTTYPATAVILLPSVFKQYQFSNGVLQRITPTIGAKKVLQPVRYTIHWQTWVAQPYTSSLASLASLALGALGL